MHPIFRPNMIMLFSYIYIRPDDSTVLVSLACGSLSGIASSTGE
jgi:hypothetical protein